MRLLAPLAVWFALPGPLAPIGGAAAADVVVVDEAPRHRGSVVVGAAASIPLADTAWGPGFAQRISGEIALGPVSSFTLDLEHARERLVDADALFPDAEVPPDAVSGARDTFLFDVGARIGVDLRRPDARDDVNAVHLVPYVRFGLVGNLVRSTLIAPAFDGEVRMPGTVAGPGVSAGAGINLRVKRWFAVNPHAKVLSLLVEDPSEDGGKDRWGVAWRVQPGLDVSFDF
jgi:hypothetical protein